MAYGDRIREARINRGLTQEELAIKIGVAKSTLTGYEKGNREPNVMTSKKIMNSLGIDANYLFQDETNALGGNPFYLKYEEINHIEKYRDLDDHGKESVEITLDRELQRVEILGKMQNKLAANTIELKKATTPQRIISYYQKLASAGNGEYLFDAIPTDTIEVPITPISEQADFVIGVNGVSMEPTYQDGDKVYVAISSEILTGGIGVFTRGNECFIKELGRDGLLSHNKNYNDIPASEDIKLVGRVLGKVEEG